MAYREKKYTRINWKNRPSTATALGATNLNHMDVFLNEVDNVLIEMEAAKLNIATANSMIASITFDKDQGLMTVKQLDGTTFTFDWNVEKIPVSFSLSENGILTMTTQDGTQFTANIADLIKDYVFDSSDTIAFTKEFQIEDDSYHVEAYVKNGSIKEEHLNPDYRADIQNFSNVAQTAANDALTYSKDSKRWAVGDAAYEGSETDNSKYYKEQAEEAKRAAEAARDEAIAAGGATIMTPEKIGVGKPDNITIKVTEDGTLSVPEATSNTQGVSRPDNTTIGLEGGALKLIATATEMDAIDTHDLVGTGSGVKTKIQSILDAIAQKLVDKVVTSDTFQTVLGKYLVNNGLTTESGKFGLDAAFGKNLQDQVTQLNSNIKEMNWKLHYSNPNVPNDIVLELPESWSEIQLLEFSNESATSGVIVINKEAFDILPIGKFVSTGYYLSQSDNAAIAFGKASTTSIRTRVVRATDQKKQSSLYIYYR